MHALNAAAAATTFAVRFRWHNFAFANWFLRFLLMIKYYIICIENCISMLENAFKNKMITTTIII